MNWLICFAVSIFILLTAVAFFAKKALAKHKRRGGISPYNILFGGVFLSVFVCLLPVCDSALEQYAGTGLKTVALALHDTFQIFTVNSDKSTILDIIEKSKNSLSDVYSTYLSLAYAIAPVLTFGFVISFVKNASAYLRYWLSFFRDTYVFSELNEKSISLGADLREKYKRAALVYTSVFEKEDDVETDLIEQARDINAICFKKDILSINFGFHSLTTKFMLFAISDDEIKNVDQSIKLIDMNKSVGAKKKKKTERSKKKAEEKRMLFVFSKGRTGEVLLSNASTECLDVRRINDYRHLINRELYQNGEVLFAGARQTEDGYKKISAVIVGMGRYGTEMINGLLWCCQVDGYRIEIDAFDYNEKAEEIFYAAEPEIDKFNGVKIPEEVEYELRIHSGYDADTKSFADEIAKLTETTYVFVSLGTDEDNIRVAANLRMIFERMNIHPIIKSIVYNSDQNTALKGIRNFKDQPYDIDFIGDKKTSYSEDVIINPKLEIEALRLNRKWEAAAGISDDDLDKTFKNYFRRLLMSEYNYNSSVAAAIRLHARIKCGVQDANTKKDELNGEKRYAIMRMEHRGWNAYVRSEGYIYSGSTDKRSRNDLAKMHNDLVPFSKLPKEEMKKDEIIATDQF